MLITFKYKIGETNQHILIQKLPNTAPKLDPSNLSLRWIIIDLSDIFYF